MTQLPTYSSLILAGKTLNYLEGLSYYIMGLTQIEWGKDIENQSKAFENLVTSCKSKYLPTDCEQWMDAHHTAANILMRHPTIVDPEYTTENGMYLRLLTPALTHSLIQARIYI